MTFPVFDPNENKATAQELINSYISQTEYYPFLQHFVENADDTSIEGLAQYILDGKHIYCLYPLTTIKNQENFEKLCEEIYKEVQERL